jgi:probable selenium-dependent hydroxylase accessory protein YqeC
VTAPHTLFAGGPPDEKLAVVGCGGKTTLIGLLARENQSRKALVMPTAKILPMRGAGVVLCATLNECLNHLPARGIQCLGVLNPATGKLEAPPPELWPQITRGYGLVLMEADGSRGLPMKGWRENEPVVPAFTTLTLGVLPVTALGLPIGTGSVHNLSQFLALTGGRAGESAQPRHLAAMAAAPGGMFKNRVGRAVLCINRVEDAHTLKAARLVAEAIQKNHPGAVDAIYAISAMQNEWRRLTP